MRISLGGAAFKAVEIFKFDQRFKHKALVFDHELSG